MSDLGMDNNRAFVINLLAGLRVKMSTYAVLNGVVHPNYVVVHDAPPVAVKTIVEKCKMVSLSAEGLLIPTNPVEQ